MFRPKPQKPMSAYYDALAQAVADVKAEFPHAYEEDAAFKKAADFVAKVVPLCKDMETLDPETAQDKDNERKELLNEIGADRLPEVQGPASKLFVEKYIELYRGMANKEYYPREDCPKLSGMKSWVMGEISMRTEYDKNFARTKERIEAKIPLLQERIEAYEATQQMRPAM